MTEDLMIFKAGQEKFGLDIRCIQELIPLPPITRVPRAEGFVHGTINYRGKIIPLCDLALKRSGKIMETGPQTVVLVAQYPIQNTDVTIGILADEVLEIKNTAAGNPAGEKTIHHLDIAKDFGTKDLTREIRYEINSRK